MIAARLRHIAGGDTDVPALMGAGASLSYAELLTAIARVRRLLERQKTQSGDFIMVSLPLDLEAVATFFSCVDLGAVFIAVNPGWRQAEIAWLLKEVAPAAAIVSSGEDQRWLGAGLAPDKIVFLNPDDSPGAENCEEFGLKHWPPDHPAACVVTSGSTGRPKISVRTQGGITANALSVAEVCEIGAGHRLLATLPLYHGSGLANNLILPLLNGATLVIPERSTPWAAAAMIERHAVDYVFSSPVFYDLMLDAQVPASKLRSLRVCLSGSAPLSLAVHQEWKRRYHLPIRQAYGSSETGIISIQSEDLAAPGFVGRPIRATEVRILTGEMEQACGEVGEIAVRGPGIVTRLLGDSETGRFWNDYLRTGDLGWADDQGRLFLSGRMRPWINIGGVKVDPLEVQQVLSKLPGILECVVQAAHGPGGMDVVAAVIAPEPGVELTRADVIQHCRKVLAEFKIPRVVRFVPALGIDLTGKTTTPWT